MLSKEIIFEKLDWKEVSLHPGVYVADIDNEPPLITTHAVLVSGKSKIGLHYHKRGEDWVETIYFLYGGNFEIISQSRKQEYNTNNPVYLRVEAKEKYGIKNLSNEQLIFLASMKPAFTGFDEIVNCEIKVKTKL